MKNQDAGQRWHSHINEADWEALCDGCGKCCMVKFEDEDTAEILMTNVACKLFDIHSCRCAKYNTRFEHVPDCLNIRDMSDEQLHWLPQTCAYRLTFEGAPLPDWHPLVSRKETSVLDAGMSMQGVCVSEIDVPEHVLIEHIVLNEA